MKSVIYSAVKKPILPYRMNEETLLQYCLKIYYFQSVLVLLSYYIFIAHANSSAKFHFMILN